MEGFDDDGCGDGIPDTRPVMGVWGSALLALVIAGGIALGLWLALRPASAHEWYVGKADPTSGHVCCGGTDCAEVPQEMLEDGAISPTADGFDVHLTVAQAQHFNRAAMQPISAHLTWARVQPSQASNKGGTGYSLCIWGDQLQCFFAPSSS